MTGRTAALLLCLAGAAGADEGPRPTASADGPQIDLYTMGPGEEPFTRFGHAAICVTDEQSPRGRCYNYGTADFSTPVPLTWNFVRGRALFWVSVQDLPRMITAYVAQDRDIYRQRLPLGPERAREIAAALEASTAKRLRYYRYHHFHDNCTTRIRDLLDGALGGLLSRDRDQHRGPTFREFVRAGFAGDLPLQLAGELLLGRAADGRTSPWQGMFLPAELRREVEARLRAPAERVYARRTPPPGGSQLLGRGALVGTGALLSLLTPLLARLGARRAALWLSGFILGVPGAALWALAALSSFGELRWNEALLCLWPSDLLLPLLPARARRRYLQVRIAVLLLVLALSIAGLLVQPLLSPLALALPPLLIAYHMTTRS